jgi:hypothetical protein
MNQISVVSESICLIAAKKLREWAELGGFETYLGTGENPEDDYRFEDFTLSPEQCEHAADQFETYSKTGDYFANIISYPHFSAKEIEAILNIF